MIRPTAGMSFANGARAFRHRNYRLFFGGQLVSLVGTWMQAVAQGWLILQLTGDPFLLGVVAAMQWIPVHGPRPVRRDHRGRPAQAADADRRPRRSRWRLSFVHVRAGRSPAASQVWQVIVLAPSWAASPTPSTCRPARRSRSRWSAARTWATPSPSTRRCSTRRASIGPAVAGLTIGAFDVSHRLPDRRRQLPRRDHRAARDARQRAPQRRPDRAPDHGQRGLRGAARGPAATSGARRWCCSAVTVVGLVVDVRHELQGGDPAARRAGPPLRRHRVRLPDGGDRASARWSAALSIAFSPRSRIGAHRRRRDPRRHRRDRPRPVVGVLPVAGADVLRRAGRDRDGRDGQHDDPARRPRPPPRPGDERLHDGVRRAPRPSAAC